MFADELGEGAIAPDDILETPRYYIGSSQSTDPVVYQQTLDAVENIKEIQGDPDAEITVYRSSPVDELNDGDWISLSKSLGFDMPFPGGLGEPEQLLMNQTKIDTTKKVKVYDPYAD